MKNRLLSFVLSLILLLSLSTGACASGLDGLFGGLTSLFSSEEKTYGVGEIAETNDLTIELTNVMESKGNSYYTPTNGNVYLILEFCINNTSKEDILLSTALCFSAWCDNELCIINSEALATAMLSGKYQLDCGVEPGKKVTGVVGYEVPKDWKEMKIQFSKEVVFGETITFAVSK